MDQWWPSSHHIGKAELKQAPTFVGSKFAMPEFCESRWSEPHFGRGTREPPSQRETSVDAIRKRLEHRLGHGLEATEWLQSVSITRLFVPVLWTGVSGAIIFAALGVLTA